MKADLSRATFAPERRFNTVLMQQGRVQVDADWNEQQAIHRERIETGALDAIGASGGRIDGAGFAIAIDGGSTLRIGQGRLYLDGLLCENATEVLYATQPYLPSPDPPLAVNLLENSEVAIVYLHARDRHVTVLDCPELRERALDGRDTTTRLQTIWQVKLLTFDEDAALAAEQERLSTLIAALETEEAAETDPADKARLGRRLAELIWQRGNVDATCALPCAEWDALTAETTGALTARTAPAMIVETRCLIPPGSGYRGLENQLYRVEIVQGGTAGAAAGAVRFAWSRENGSVVTPVVAIDPAMNSLTVANLGPDEVLGFDSQVLLEVSDGWTELHAGATDAPGFIGRGLVDRDLRRITLQDAPPVGFLQAMVDRGLAAHHAKVRRWEGSEPVVSGAPMPLEENIEVEFAAGTYRTGDYWLIPARAGRGHLNGGGEGVIEWPTKPGSDEPAARPPLGMQHHFCRLAAVTRRSDNTLVFLDDGADCRRFFPAATDLIELSYVGGQGQTANAFGTLPHPLRVAVTNGRWPVAGARVYFQAQVNGSFIPVDSGLVEAGDNSIEVLTASDGLATVDWELDPDPSLTEQQAVATLLDSDGEALSTRIFFSARLAPPAPATPPELGAIHVISVTDGEGTPLENDRTITPQRLETGIIVQFDREIDPRVVRGRDETHVKPVLLVTVGVGYPSLLNRVGTWPLTLSGTLEVTGGSDITWLPTEPVRTWLPDEPDETFRLLGHLTLKGNAIWAVDDPAVNLDGEVFGVPRDDDTTDMPLPSGDGQRGGDFEMWFWLEWEF